MKRATVELRVSVQCEVPDHVYERDKANHGELSEADIWHDYAIGCVTQNLETLHGNDDENDWVKLFAEVVDCELEEGPEDTEEGEV